MGLGKSPAAMSLAEKIQQAEERHAGGQLTGAELESIRIKSASQEEFDRLQATGQGTQKAEVAQVAQEKIERLLEEVVRQQQ